MKIFHHLLRCTAAAVALVLVNCAAPKKPLPTVDANGRFVNPYPPGSYDHFITEPSYPKTYSVWKNEDLLAGTTPENSSLRLVTGTQRGLLMRGREIVMDYPICTGRSGHETPTGEYQITEMVVDKRSNRYGRIYDAEGDCVESDADILKDAVPEGGRFEGAPMRYWMRLTNDGIGHHVGPVKRYRASHGCIRGPASAVPIVHKKVKPGTPVVVE
jgi:hypothetical protein